MENIKELKRFIVDLEAATSKKLNYPAEIEKILEIVAKTGMSQECNELIFHAKFLTKSSEIMERIGSGDVGFEKLSKEFQSGLKKTEDIFNSIVQRDNSDTAKQMKNIFDFSRSENYNNLKNLFSDLSRLKNWQIDGKPLPYEESGRYKTVSKNSDNKVNKDSLIRIQKSALVIAVLSVFFLLLDPPVTIIGWALALVILVFVIYIILQTNILKKT